MLDHIFLKEEFVKRNIFVHSFNTFQILRVAHLTFKKNISSLFATYIPAINLNTGRFLQKKFYQKSETTKDILGCWKAEFTQYCPPVSGGINRKEDTKVRPSKCIKLVLAKSIGIIFYQVVFSLRKCVFSQTLSKEEENVFVWELSKICCFFLSIQALL